MILEQLNRIRTTVRRRLFLWGLCAVLAGGCLAFLTVLTLDWLLRLPPPLRLAGTALFIVGLGLAVLRWVVGPLRAPLTLPRIAARLEDFFGGLDNRLSSTVNFLSTPTDASPAFVHRVVEDTRQIVGTLSLTDALTLRPLARHGLMLVCGLGVLFAVGAISPDWIRVGVMRYARPFEDVEWPHRVHIRPMTEDLTVPMGESASVAMKVTRGWGDELRGILHLVDDRGSATVLTTFGDERGQYRWTIDGVTANMDYWFEAGDDSTRRQTGRITVVRRPALADVEVTCRPPAYAGDVEPIQLDLRAATGSATVVPGTRVVLYVRSTKPVGIDRQGQPSAWIERVEGGHVPLKMVGDDPRLMQACLLIERDEVFRIRLIDRLGLGNLTEGDYRILTRPDTPPRVVLHEPQGSVELTPRGRVRVTARAEDDFGLKDLRLVGRVDEAATTINQQLLESAQVSRTEHQYSAVVGHVLDIEPMGLAPGATLRCSVLAVDNYPGSGATGQSGSSSQFQVRVISEAQFEQRLGEEFALLQRHIRGALLEQQGIGDETDALFQKLESARSGVRGSGRRTNDPLERSPAESAMGLGARQDRLARRTAHQARRFEDTRRRMMMNRLDDPEADRGLATISATLVEIATTAMTQAADALRGAGQRPDWPSVPDHRPGLQVRPEQSQPVRQMIAEARDHQEETVASLRGMLRQMERWSDFQSMIAQTRDLLDRQQQAGEGVGQLARHTLGRRVDELTTEQQRRLTHLERQQWQLGEDLQRLLQRLRATVEDASVEPSLDASAVEAAVRAIVAAEIIDRMEGAARAIQGNRMSAAAIEQRAAETGLHDVLAAFEERRTSPAKLLELVKRLERLEQTAAALLEQQKQLLAATNEALSLSAEPDAFHRLAEQQGRLQTNTAGLGQDVAASRESMEAAQAIERAAAEMERARTRLVEARGSDAIEPQQGAADNLTEAVSILEERARQMAHMAWQGAMAAIRGRLEDLRDRQAEINEGTEEILQVVAEGGRLNRQTARRVVRLATTQAAARDDAEQVSPDLGETIVYRRVMEQIVEDMTTSRNALEGRRLDAGLRATQDRITRWLDQLIRALGESERLPPSDEFAEGGGGGEGGTPGHAPRAVPAVAELFMLKAMQSDLIADTVKVGSIEQNGGNVTEAQLAAVEALGERQQEIRELTELVTRRARGGHGGR